MTDKEIQARLSNQEDSFVERKTEGDHKDFLKTIVAFANSIPEGGTGILFIGVTRDGTVPGLGNEDKLQKTVSDIAQTKCYPPIDVQQRVLQHGEKTYLAVMVPFSANRPHFGGPAWVRDGSRTLVASDRLFQELIDSRTSKVYEILKWKDRETIMVEVIGKKLGESMPLRDPLYRQVGEYYVLSCNSHFVRLMSAASTGQVTEPLENITITEEVATKRLKLLVHPRRVGD